MIAVGVIAAWIITNRRAEKQKLDHEHVFSLVIWCLLGGMFCAKILFLITEWKDIVGIHIIFWIRFQMDLLYMEVLSADSGRLSVLLYQKDRFLEYFDCDAIWHLLRIWKD